ncbi:MAG: ACT domain-containing protein [Planctomycetota bacterium]|nr:MAG: ACT domain-containing protein [Planctomycetota bacterium]
MQSQRLTEFSIYLAQRPGELAGLLEAAAAASVNILGISVSEYKDRGLVKLIAEPEEALRHVCESLVEAGVGPVVESPVIAFDIENRPGALRDVAVGLADARVNIQHVYLTAPGADRPSRAVMRVDDLDRAEQAIAALEWPDHATE